MEEIEVPTEQLQEEIHAHAHGSAEKWQLQVALTSALLAVLAALAALLSGHDANEAMIEQIQSANAWSHYQAKGIKAVVQRSQLEILQSLGKSSVVQPKAEFDRYKKEQEEIAEEAKEKSLKSERLLARHGRYSFAVTFFQVGIGVAAISVLTRRRSFWKLSLLFGLVGFVMLISGFLAQI